MAAIKAVGHGRMGAIATQDAGARYMTVASLQICDECGCSVAKIHRVRKGRRYCATCYARIFKPRLCPKCGGIARLPKNELEAVCGRCEIAKPCARCGKREYRIGKITPYGPVCNACVPHFSKPEPCEACGTLSSKLTRVARLGHDMRLCPKCARADYGTCAACRRHRLLNEAPDGRLLCKTCREKGEIRCPSCGSSMPAGRGNICEACYWTATCRKRITIDQEALSTPAMRAAFGEFGEWLIGEIGPHKAALTLHRYLPFFMEVDRLWGSIPSYHDVLKQFGAEGLRRVRIVMRWLNETKDIQANQLLREEDSERRRIGEILNFVPQNTRAGRTLLAYYQHLMNRVNAGKTSLRSVRLALRPAATLLTVADPSGEKLPDQAVLDRYLRDAPGQKAAITGFVNFFNEREGSGLTPQVDERRTRDARRKRLEAKLMEMARQGGEGKDFERQWLEVTLAYFHGLSNRVVKNISEECLLRQIDGFSISWNGKTYWVPSFANRSDPQPQRCNDPRKVCTTPLWCRTIPS